ncbi:ABC transporter permease, partial [Hymenobacter sp.]|uniref:MlaE family ABC transporter permease n=1 Tax=Hymenobacter sp. TaxID=1898978 RepID=UPI00286D677E
LAESLYWIAVGRRHRQPVRIEPVIAEMMEIGVRAIPICALLLFTVGLMLAIQGLHTLETFGAETKLVPLVALSITREFAPLIVGILVAGRSGSALAARIGTMQVSQEIDALRVIGVNPVRYLVAPSLVAMLIMLPVLTVLADGIGLFASYVGINTQGVTTMALFVNNVLGNLTFGDVLPAFIKTFFFGFAIGLIGCYKGYYADKGTEGVGQAANSAVVVSSLVVFILDLLAVQITGLLGIN